MQTTHSVLGNKLIPRREDKQLAVFSVPPNRWSRKVSDQVAAVFLQCHSRYRTDRPTLFLLLPLRRRRVCFKPFVSCDVLKFLFVYKQSSFSWTVCWRGAQFIVRFCELWLFTSTGKFIIITYAILQSGILGLDFLWALTIIFIG